VEHYQEYPSLKRLHHDQKHLVPTLKITIVDRSYFEPLPRTHLITNPESIQRLNECFWRIGVTRGGLDAVPLRKKGLTPKLHSRIPSRLEEAQEPLLNPFNTVPGFGFVVVYGAEEEFRRSLLKRIVDGPTSNQATELIEGNTAAAEQAYRTGNYEEALVRWKRVHLYQQWILEQLVNSRCYVEDWSLEDVLKYPSLETLQSVLGETKAFLQIGEYEKAVELAHRGLEMNMDGGDPSARIILRGKLDLIAAMARQMMMDHTQWGMSYFWYPVTLLQQGPWSAKSLERVLKEHFLAKEVYPENEWMGRFLASKAVWELIDNQEEGVGCRIRSRVDTEWSFPQKTRDWNPRATGR